ncbi:MAG TPA: hypothetical protein VGI17_15255 [Solirubrobacterales bacterium]
MVDPPKGETLPEESTRVDDEEPVVVLTLGRPRLRTVLPFLRSSAAAEHALADAPGLLASTGFARPPLRLVSTFSVWESAAAMRAYAHDNAGAHMGAVRNDRAVRFHHESAFIRWRPYRSAGLWAGRDPLAGRLRDEELAA